MIVYKQTLASCYLQDQTMYICDSEPQKVTMDYLVHKHQLF